MKYSITKNWIASFELIAKKRIVLLPFIVIAFLECMAAELIYFSTRQPISKAAVPIIRKFFGEAFTHYPGILLLFPRLFYYAQVMIYILSGAMLSAMAINIYKNVIETKPIRLNAMAKNGFRRYFSYFIYAVIIILGGYIIKKADTFAFSNIAVLASKFTVHINPVLFSTLLILAMFIANVTMETLLILTLPLMVLREKSFLKSLGSSISLGVRNFFKLFALIFLPFVLYLPLMLLKSFPNELADKMFPEINLWISILGSIFTIFVDCFMTVSVSRWVLDNTKEPKK